MATEIPESSRTPAQVRRTPCASCPYRKDAPSGIWAQAEYDMLPDFDGTPAGQAVSEHGTHTFGCHQGDGKLCAGWAGHRDPHDLLAIRLGVSQGKIAPEALGYSTDVPLFSSGAEARDHGMRDYEHPSEKAMSQVAKIITVRKRRGEPVSLDTGVIG